MRAKCIPLIVPYPFLSLFPFKIYKKRLYSTKNLNYISHISQPLPLSLPKCDLKALKAPEDTECIKSTKGSSEG